MMRRMMRRMMMMMMRRMMMRRRMMMMMKMKCFWSCWWWWRTYIDTLSFIPWYLQCQFLGRHLVPWPPNKLAQSPFAAQEQIKSPLEKTIFCRGNETPFKGLEPMRNVWQGLPQSPETTLKNMRNPTSPRDNTCQFLGLIFPCNKVLMADQVWISRLSDVISMPEKEFIWKKYLHSDLFILKILLEPQNSEGLALALCHIQRSNPRRRQLQPSK